MRTFLILLLINIATISNAQTDSYKSIYQKADSLTIQGKLGVIDPKIYKIADSLSTYHPMEYFKTTAEYLKQQKYNEASFLYYLGYFRYKYFNSSNPGYQASGDGALAGALSSVLGEPISMYMHSNIENFTSILEKTLQYMQSNDFAFYSKEKDLEKYNKQLKNAAGLLDDLKTNKAKWEKVWKEERKEMEELLKETN